MVQARRRKVEYKFKEYVKSELITGHLKMGGTNFRGEKIEANSLYFKKDGIPWIGTMGEYHFSRADKSEWYRELCKMKAGGISIVSTYVFGFITKKRKVYLTSRKTMIYGPFFGMHRKSGWKSVCGWARG